MINKIKKIFFKEYGQESQEEDVSCPDFVEPPEESLKLNWKSEMWPVPKEEPIEEKWPIPIKNLDEDIKVAAYLKWETAGKPEGKSDYFWQEAEKEIKSCEYF